MSLNVNGKKPINNKMENLIVSDSGPLISMARARKLNLIQKVCRQIIIPESVYREIVIQGKGKPGAREIENASWINVKKAQSLKKVEILKNRFGSGESEAVVLAEETGAILLVDEKFVIKEARKRGLKIYSTHLLLEEAKRIGLIESVKKELDELIEAGFRTTPELIENTLKKSGEI